MASLYFCDHPIDASSRSVQLTGAEAKHAATVARVRVGETVWVSDGHGTRARGAVVSVTPSQVDLSIDAVESLPQREPELWLVQALAKGDRDERAIEMATELGVDRIIPWAAARSVSRWDGKEAKAVDRWRAIVREASKQSIRARIPVVTGPVTSAELTAMVNEAYVLVLHPSAEQRLTDVDVLSAQTSARAIAVVVGPEGGLSPEEVDGFRNAGADVVRLGQEVLRTSTAGAAALSTLSVQLGRW